MGMMNELAIEDKSSSKRRTKPPNAGIIRDFAVVGPGSDTTWKHDTYETENPQGNWDRKALQISDIYSGTGHPVILAAALYLTGHLQTKVGKDNVH